MSSAGEERRARALMLPRLRLRLRGSPAYRRQTRGLAEALRRSGVRVALEGAWPVPSWRGHAWKELLGATSVDVMLHACRLQELVLEPGWVNVYLTGWDIADIPATRVAGDRLPDLVLVPTRAARHAWLAAGVQPDLVQVCPLGIDVARFTRRATPLRLWSTQGEELSRVRVRFLIVASLEPRGNVLGLLRAWIRATTPSDDAVLVVALSAEPGPRLDAFRLAVAGLSRELGRGLESAAAVWFHHARIAERGLPRLYAAATHYITLSHGEVWDERILEAGAAGLALIAPRHSAYTECLNASTAHLIACGEVPYGSTEGFFTDGAHGVLAWWAPDEDEAVAAIRMAIASDESAGVARAHIVREYGWEQTARRLIAVLGALAARGRV